MKNLIKWCLIICLSLIFLIIAALLVIPHFIDIQRYKPVIEKKVTAVTGRSFTIGDDLNLSLFPVASISFSDLHLGNPPEFGENDFIMIKSFEAQVDIIKLILSLFKDIRITRFIVKGPEIMLIQKKGLANWEGIRQSRKDAPASPEPKLKTKPESASKKSKIKIPVKSFNVDEFSISGGSIIYIDETRGIQQKISDLTLDITDLSLDHPIHINFSAKLADQPVSLKGIAGPIGDTMFKGKIPFDISLIAANQLYIKIDGSVINPAGSAEAEIKLKIEPFSPRKLYQQLGLDFPARTSDPDVLKLAALSLHLKKDTSTITISDGLMEIDASKLNFSATAKELSKPALNFNLKLDQIDLDKYLPPVPEKRNTKPEPKKPDARIKEAAKDEKQTKTAAILDSKPTSKPAYTTLRKLILKGRVKIDKLKIKKAKINDLDLFISGKNGIFKIDPLTLHLYQGDLTTVGIVDIKTDTPKSSLALDIKNLDTGGLLTDMLEHDILEGILNTTLNLKTTGNTPLAIKQSLNGSGKLNLTDGAIKGIDLTAMVKQTKSAFINIMDKEKEPVTKFGNFFSSFNIVNGIVNVSDTEFISHDIRLAATGKADLVKELLNFRLEPFLIEKKDAAKKIGKYSKYLIPVLVTGNFSSPEFRPDLKKLINKNLEKQVFESSEFKKIFKNEELKPLEEAAKEILKGIFK